MKIVFLTALGVGGASIMGAALGFVFKDISKKFSNVVLAFAAGVMLCASVVSLIMPSLEYTNRFPVLVTTIGIICGALCIDFADKFVPHLHKLAGVDENGNFADNQNLTRVLLFVLAIAIHNLPEGIAAGVGFGTGNATEAITIALGIALQNIPEGMVIISPMLNAGVSKGRTFFAATLAGIVEVFGTLIGYFAVSLSNAILPFALAFAGGTMLYVISRDMIPETHADGSHAVTYSLLVGFIVMLAIGYYLG